MLTYQKWDEINKYFALTFKLDKETDTVVKDLYFTDTHIGKYFTYYFCGLTCVLQMTIHYTAAAEESRMAVKGPTYKLKKKKKKKKKKARIRRKF